MHKALAPQFILVYILIAGMFGAALFLRPPLPIDETRYLTVAWELFLQRDYSLLTLNFEPYHHKPPLLFWLINISWNIFGVSRWAALVPFFLIALSHVFLTRALAMYLLPNHKELHGRLPYLTLASFPFIIYSTIIMFDIMLTVFVLAMHLMFFSYSREPKIWKSAAAGIFLGLGGLTKGPVIFIYTLLPLLLFYAWEKRKGLQNNGRILWRFFSISLAVGLALISVWLFDLFGETGDDFAHSLLYTQTVGRIDGKMESSHARPIYFFLPFLPVLFLPWVLFPAFWKNAKAIFLRIKNEAAIRFIVVWFAGCLVCFSLISGKQPHYLVPLLPPALIFIGLCLEKVSIKAIKTTAFTIVVLVIAGQAVAARFVFPYYDLRGLSKVVAQHHDKDWAFVRKYQGELGFLGRIDRHIDSLEFHDVPLWFKQHPEGYVVIRHDPVLELPEYHQIYSMPYRSRALGIFTRGPEVEKLKNLPEQ